jgi:hypothetical protein
MEIKTIMQNQGIPSVDFTASFASCSRFYRAL